MQGLMNCSRTHTVGCLHLYFIASNTREICIDTYFVCCNTMEILIPLSCVKADVLSTHDIAIVFYFRVFLQVSSLLNYSE